MSGAADEHDYIEHLIVDRWSGQAERKIFPLRDDARACLFSGRLGEALILEVRAAQMAQQMLLASWVGSSLMRHSVAKGGTTQMFARQCLCNAILKIFRIRYATRNDAWRYIRPTL